jgi:hypothetical protein
MWSGTSRWEPDLPILNHHGVFESNWDIAANLGPCQDQSVVEKLVKSHSKIAIKKDAYIPSVFVQSDFAISK